MLQAVRVRRFPRFVKPWVQVCPACQVRLASTLHNLLAARQLVQCSALTCRCWLLPSEAL